ncbi:hypothetical protein FS837_003211 [Tulasnella sp. UAMH 9824]|nr:hypothetical protein FS837_003211 [Tulasnella sp. UAMH 9824]
MVLPQTWWMAETIKTKLAADQLPTSLKIYSSEPRFPFFLRTIGVPSEDSMHPVDQFGTLPSDSARLRDQLARDIRSTSLFADDVGAMIDVVVLGSCEVDLKSFGSDLLEAWNERPHDKKFILACGVPNDYNTDSFEYISEWSQRDSLRVIPMANHFVDYFHPTLDTRADAKGLLQSPSLDKHVDIETFSSVSEFIDFPPRPKTYLDHVPCSAVLQGNYHQGGKNFERIFRDLKRLLQEDSRGWGYKWSAQERKYVVDAASPHPPFVLHLIGGDVMNIPSELQDVFVRDAGLGRTPFYELFEPIDIVVPVAADGGYSTRQAASAVHTAIMTHVSLLTTRALLECCPYLNSESMIIRPPAISEMEAIGLLRGAKVTAQGAELSEEKSQPPVRFNDLSEAIDGPPELIEDVKRMVSQGWRRGDENLTALQREIRRQNENVVSRILQDC